MRLPLALVPFLFAACAACSRPRPVPPPRSTVADLVEKTVALVRAEADGDSVSVQAYCSGVWVGPKRFLTAGHCVHGAAELTFVTQPDVISLDGEAQREAVDTTLRKAKVLAVDTDHDVAVLEAEGTVPGHPYARLASARTGDHVRSMGHPLGLWWSYSEGNVAALRRLPEDETTYVQATAPISPGNSGGGLFDDQGNVVGICHAYFPKGENLNLYVDSRYAKDLLDKVGA